MVNLGQTLTAAHRFNRAFSSAKLLSNTLREQDSLLESWSKGHFSSDDFETFLAFLNTDVDELQTILELLGESLSSLSKAGVKKAELDVNGRLLSRVARDLKAWRRC